MVEHEIVIRDKKTGAIIGSINKDFFEGKSSWWNKWLSPETIIKLLSGAAMLFAFFLQTNNTVLKYVEATNKRIEIIEKQQAINTSALSKVADFIADSDTFHSALTKIPFKNGKPIYPAYGRDMEPISGKE